MPRSKTTNSASSKRIPEPAPSKSPATRRASAADAARKSGSNAAAAAPTQRAAAARAAGRLSLEDVMRRLEKEGSAQTRKTYLRHGAVEPMFGVSFAALKQLVKEIKVDHELAHRLWETGNHDARMLAIKVADPATVSPQELDRWAAGFSWWMCGGYVAALAAESPHGRAKAKEWLASPDAGRRATGWMLVGYLAQLDASEDDAVFARHLERIESTIRAASNLERDAMIRTLIAIGCRTPALRKAAVQVAKRLGTIEVDYGDTDCKTPDVAVSVEKAWAHATSKKFPSPAAQERAREPMRLRC
ncbi:MAG TPA: DNA alkylation repair protein [Planctomycetota bacterium]|nr:DNA alkylation repair protein [Planctomycetota bacterium]